MADPKFSHSHVLGEVIVTVHVCDLPRGHETFASDEKSRRHRCRKCGFWWVALDHNPFADVIRSGQEIGGG
jgi:hypothetical protein